PGLETGRCGPRPLQLSEHDCDVPDPELDPLMAFIGVRHGDTVGSTQAEGLVQPAHRGPRPLVRDDQREPRQFCGLALVMSATGDPRTEPLWNHTAPRGTA